MRASTGGDSLEARSVLAEEQNSGKLRKHTCAFKSTVGVRERMAKRMTV